jgi:hypothetical protein
MTAVGFVSNKEWKESFSNITFPPFLKSRLLFKFTLKVISNYGGTLIISHYKNNVWFIILGHERLNAK